MISYLIQSTTILTLFYVVYKMFLVRFTHFQNNRFFLLFGLSACLILPFLNLNFSAEKTEYVYVSKSVFEMGNAVDSLKHPNPVSFLESLTLLRMIEFLYWLGVLASVIVTGYQLFKIWKIIAKGELVYNDGLNLIFTDEKLSPFSFFNKIVINRNLISEQELEHIIVHEKIHINQWHQLDLIFAKLLNIVLWFFPVSYYFAKSIRTNLEFIADDCSLKSGLNKIDYQYSLLTMSGNSFDSEFVNNFSKKLIKNRIKMLNKTKTSKNFIYFLTFPLVSFMAFGVAVKAQSDSVKINQIVVIYDDEVKKDDLQIMQKNEKGEYEPIDSAKTIIISMADWTNKNKSLNNGLSKEIESGGKHQKKSDVTSETFKMTGDEILIQIDSVTGNQFLVFKDTLNKKTDTIYITKDGVYTRKNPIDFEKLNLDKKTLELLKNGKNYQLPQLKSIPLVPPVKTNEYEGYHKLLENWYGGVYADRKSLKILPTIIPPVISQIPIIPDVLAKPD